MTIPDTLETLAAIRDVPVRARALEIRLRVDPRAGAAALDRTARRAAHGEGRSRDVLLAWAWLRAVDDDLSLVASLADCCADLEAAAPLVRTTPAARALPAHARIEAKVRFAPVYMPPDLRASVRRGQMKRLLTWTHERMHRDPRAVIARRLLDDSVTELRDVLRMAARRPSSPPIARTIAASRWVTELAVREALVRNPFTPTWLSLALLPIVRTRVVDLAVAHEEVRAYARLLGRHA